MYQAYAQTCNFLIPMIVFIRNCKQFWARFIQVFWLTYMQVVLSMPMNIYTTVQLH